jgi:hypothetical protein
MNTPLKFLISAPAGGLLSFNFTFVIFNKVAVVENPEFTPHK